MAKQAWIPWHKVVELRADLLSGDLPMHMFAADLYEVLMQGGKRPVYEDPKSFFALTYPTHNLRNLVRDVVLRVAGKNDKAIRQLELTYGGGKTHTLITLRHLVSDPRKLPDVPAVREFEQAIGEKPTQARIAGLCCDKLDVEKGMDVRDPKGMARRLIHPWSILAWQLAGEKGLKLLHPKDKAEERDSPPAENLLTDLLQMPVEEGLGVLVLLDEVLMFARQKVAQDRRWAEILQDFFDYLTRAATKVNRCCVVASLLASDPSKSDILGRELQSDLYDTFNRLKEEVVEPVTKDDAAEVLRRRFFTPDSIKDREAFKPHVIAALQGIKDIDEHTRKHGQAAEDELLNSYPFHPRLTDVFYSKWTSLDRFQRTRGVLRTFALALREAANWDDGPLIGPTVFLRKPGQTDLSDAVRELVTVADREETEGRAVAWAGILDGELGRAREVQVDSVGLKQREVERAVMATFLHSQPIGQSAKTRDIHMLLGDTRPDKIELEKGLVRWAQTSHWLDDRHAAPEGSLPTEWRLGNRPNLNQMHAKATLDLSDDVVEARLLSETEKVRALTQGASAAGVRVHTLPEKARDIEDDGQFHFAIMPPSAASESGKPSSEAKRFLDETSGPDKPRVFRNAVILLCPSRDGLEAARAKIRDYLAWEQVKSDLDAQEKNEGATVDIGRKTTLATKIESARKHVAPAIKQAYCIVVTVNEQNDVHAFKVTVTDDPLFQTIKEDKRSRMQDTPVNAEALLPGGPYDLWRDGETSRRVKDLAGAFAQLPRLPKMLKAQALYDTLAEGCEQGNFVAKLNRPDRSFRTLWRLRPEAAIMQEPALELVLPQNAELATIEPRLLEPSRLPKLWTTDVLPVAEAQAYFRGGHVIQIDKGGYEEATVVPKAAASVVLDAIRQAVEGGRLWLTNGPATVLGEPIPTGVLNEAAELRRPLEPIAAAELLPANLPAAWTDGQSSAMSVATALSNKQGRNLPWTTVAAAISSAINARFLELADGSSSWPCEYPSAARVVLKEAPAGVRGGTGARSGAGAGQQPIPTPGILVGSSELEPHELQDLADNVQKILEVKAQTGVPVRFHLRIEVGETGRTDSDEAAARINAVLKEIREDFRIGQ
jgi:hypothetical protein